MKKIKDITEDEMVATFLKGEINSKRFGYQIYDALEELGLDDGLIRNPKLNRAEENNTRKKILRMARGYNSFLLFEGYPQDVKWVRATITKKELLDIRYINYSYWLEITQGSRKLDDAVKTIKEGKEVFNVSNDNFLEAAEEVKKGTSFPELILVTKGNDHPLVVLEGHLRATAYRLSLEYIPDEIEVLLGTSDDFDQWGHY